MIAGFSGVVALALAGASVIAPSPSPAPPSPLPVIGTTHSRPLCTAVRQSIAPAVMALMRVDGGLVTARKTLHDLAQNAGDPQATMKYEGNTSNDMQRMRLAALARAMSRDLELVKVSLAGLPQRPAAGSDDRDVEQLRARLAAVAARQQDAVNAVGGLVETELEGQMRTEFDSRLGPELPNGDQNPPPLPPAMVGSGLQMKDPLPVFDKRRQLAYGNALGHTLYDQVSNDVGRLQTSIATEERAVTPALETAAHTCGAPGGTP